MTENKGTIKDAYKRSLVCQDAVNLSGVVLSMARDMALIWEEARAEGKGTEYVNTHPIVLAYLDKLCHLAKIQSFEYSDKISTALHICADKGGVHVEGSSEG